MSTLIPPSYPWFPFISLGTSYKWNHLAICCVCLTYLIQYIHAVSCVRNFFLLKAE